MKKIDVKFPKSDLTKKFDYNEQEIEVVEFIPLTTRILLANEYLMSYFHSGLKDIEDMFLCKWDYLGAENVFKLSVVDKLTNIKVFSKDGSPAINVDEFMKSKVWNEIIGNISNYNSFKKELDVLVANVKESKSIGVVMDELADKAFKFIESLSELDLSESGIEKLSEKFSDLKDSPVVKALAKVES